MFVLFGFLGVSSSFLSLTYVSVFCTTNGEVLADLVVIIFVVCTYVDGTSFITIDWTIVAKMVTRVRDGATAGGFCYILFVGVY